MSVTKIPNSVMRYLYSITMKDRLLACIFVDPDGTIYDWYGNLAAYDIATPEVGDPIGKRVLALEGMFPLDQAIFTLPTVEISSGKYADIHILKIAEGHCAAFLDKNEEVHKQQLYQQRGNELNLLREKHAKILQQFVGTEVAQGLSDGSLTTRAWGRRKNITVLWAGISQFAQFSESHEPAVVFETLNIYLQDIINSIIDAKGLVDSLAGQNTSALFGVVSSEEAPPVQAVRAAVDILKAIQETNNERQREGSATLDIGIGVGTGLAALGILGTKSRRTFSAIGHHVSLAHGLMTSADSGEILIDLNTYEKISMSRDLFLPRATHISGLEDTVDAYSYRLP